MSEPEIPEEPIEVTLAVAYAKQQKEIESLKGLEDHLNKRDKINRDKIEQLQKDNERLREGIRKITKVNPPAFSNLSPIEVVAMSPHELIPHVKELLSNNSIGEE